MKRPIIASEIHDSLLKINRQRIIYYQKVSEKMRELNLKNFLNGVLVGDREKEPTQIRETKPSIDVVSGPIQRSKFHRLGMKVKTIIYNAYELEK